MSDSTDPGGQASGTGPTKEAIATVVVTIGLLVGLVWYIRPPRAHFTPAPLQALPDDCPKVDRPFVPSNITDLPGQPVVGLDPQQRLRALYRMNFEPCPCGCNQSIAECLVNHPQCKVCRNLAAGILEKAKSEAPKPR
jgi:hypothetical protein